MKSSSLWLVAGLLALLLVVMLVTPTAQADDAATVYKAKCQMCHAPDGSGNSPTGKAMKVPDLRADETQKKTDAQLIDATANGKGKMPAFKGKLTDEEIKDLVKYIRGLAKK